jgi:hypothetical protein
LELPRFRELCAFVVRPPLAARCSMNDVTNRTWQTRCLLGLLAVSWLVLGVADARAQSAVEAISPPPIVDEEPIGIAPAPSTIQPITDVVPLWGKDLRDSGVDLPLPFGLGLTYTYINQNTQVHDVQIQGRPVGVSIPDAKTTSSTLTFRADAWLLPFLNVYGLLGYTSGTTRPEIRLPNGTSIGDSVDYSRAMYGGGATLAGGYKAYFLTLDANYTTGAIQAEKGQVGDRNLYSITFTPRAGAVFSSGELGTGSLWVGGMYMDFAQQVQGSVSLARGDPRLPDLAGRDDVSYSVRIRAKDPWNVLLGGSWELSKRWSIALELGGVLDRFQATGAAMFRF